MIAVSEGDVAIDICRAQLTGKKYTQPCLLIYITRTTTPFDYQERIFFAPKTCSILSRPLSLPSQFPVILEPLRHFLYVCWK